MKIIKQSVKTNKKHEITIRIPDDIIENEDIEVILVFNDERSTKNEIEKFNKFQEIVNQFQYGFEKEINIDAIANEVNSDIF